MFWGGKQLCVAFLNVKAAHFTSAVRATKTVLVATGNDGSHSLQAMEHAADSTPEAIVGSPKEVVNSTFLPGVGLRRGNSTTWRGLSRLRMSDDVLNTHASSEHAALGPASSALRKSQQQQPRKQKKQSVQDRLRKKLRIK